MKLMNMQCLQMFVVVVGGLIDMYTNVPEFSTLDRQARL